MSSVRSVSDTYDLKRAVDGVFPPAIGSITALKNMLAKELVAAEKSEEGAFSLEINAAIARLRCDGSSHWRRYMQKLERQLQPDFYEILQEDRHFVILHKDNGARKVVSLDVHSVGRSARFNVSVEEPEDLNPPDPVRGRPAPVQVAAAPSASARQPFVAHPTTSHILPQPPISVSQSAMARLPATGYSTQANELQQAERNPGYYMKMIAAVWPSGPSGGTDEQELKGDLAQRMLADWRADSGLPAYSVPFEKAYEILTSSYRRLRPSSKFPWKHPDHMLTTEGIFQVSAYRNGAQLVTLNLDRLEEAVRGPQAPPAPAPVPRPIPTAGPPAANAADGGFRTARFITSRDGVIPVAQDYRLQQQTPLAAQSQRAPNGAPQALQQQPVQYAQQEQQYGQQYTQQYVQPPQQRAQQEQYTPYQQQQQQYQAAPVAPAPRAASRPPSGAGYPPAAPAASRYASQGIPYSQPGFANPMAPVAGPPAATGYSAPYPRQSPTSDPPVVGWRSPEPAPQYGDSTSGTYQAPTANGYGKQQYNAGLYDGGRQDEGLPYDAWATQAVPQHLTAPQLAAATKGAAGELYDAEEQRAPVANGGGSNGWGLGSSNVASSTESVPGVQPRSLVVTVDSLAHVRGMQRHLQDCKQIGVAGKVCEQVPDLPLAMLMVFAPAVDASQGHLSDVSYLVDFVSLGREAAAEAVEVLRERLENTAVTKCMHDARLLVHALREAFGISVVPIFDTQVAFGLFTNAVAAAALTGVLDPSQHDPVALQVDRAEQPDVLLAYGGLTEEQVATLKRTAAGVASSPAGWARRPLTSEMRRYLEHEVRHLVWLAQQLREDEVPQQVLLRLWSQEHARWDLHGDTGGRRRSAAAAAAPNGSPDQKRAGSLAEVKKSLAGGTWEEGDALPELLMSFPSDSCRPKFRRFKATDPVPERPASVIGSSLRSGAEGHDEFMDAEGGGEMEGEADLDAVMQSIMAVMPAKLSKALEPFAVRGAQPSVVEIVADQGRCVEVHFKDGSKQLLPLQADVPELVSALAVAQQRLGGEQDERDADEAEGGAKDTDVGAADQQPKGGKGLGFTSRLWNAIYGSQDPGPAVGPGGSTRPGAGNSGSGKGGQPLLRDPFRQDNRLTVPGTLHRVCAMRATDDMITGLTYRVGRPVQGVGDMFLDLLTRMCSEPSALDGLGEEAVMHSMLLIGRPGVGKTTILRDLARLLADRFGKATMIVDTSNEIAGDGAAAHACVGSARRMMVRDRHHQHEVLVEAVQNHAPEVIVVDEIGTVEEVRAARTISQRGVALIATVHGATLQSLVNEKEVLNPLVGGTKNVTLGDEEARKRNQSVKTRTERAGAPTFSMAIEVLERNRWRVHHSVARSVDAILAGRQPDTEVRRYDDDGRMLVMMETEGALRRLVDEGLVDTAAGSSAAAAVQDAGGDKLRKSVVMECQWLLDSLHLAMMASADAVAA